MKKFLGLTSALLLAFALVGCSSSTSSDDEDVCMDDSVCDLIIDVSPEE